MSHPKVGSKVRKKVIIQFLALSFLFALIPVTTLYVNSTIYSENINEFLKNSDKQLGKVVTESQLENESAKRLKDIHKAFHQMTLRADSTLTEIRFHNQVVVGLSVALVALLAFIAAFRIRESMNKIIRSERVHRESLFNRILKDMPADIELPEYPGLNIRSGRSALGEGGEFRVVSQSGNSLMFIILEVMEAGKTESYLSNYFVDVFRKEFRKDEKLNDLFDRMNQRLTPIVRKHGLSISAFCGVLDMNLLSLRYVNAGFKGPIHFSTSGKGIQILTISNDLFGKESYYTEQHLSLGRTDKILLYNRHLSFEVQGEVYTLRLSSSDEELVSRASINGISSQLSEALESRKSRETMLFLDFNQEEKNHDVEVSAHFKEGSHYYLENMFDKALDSFQKVIELNPTHVKALSNIGLIHYRNGDYTLAKEAWSKVLRLDPGSTKIQQNLLVLNKKIAISSQLG